MGHPTVTFGGVKLNRSEVAKMTKTTLPTFGGKKETYYIVEFKNGVKVSYSNSNGGTISATTDSVTATTNIYNVMGLELIGSKEMDDIHVKNSTVRWIDTSEDNHGDYVTIDKSEIAKDRQCVLPQKTDKHIQRTPGNIIIDRRDQVYFDNRMGSNIFSVKKG